MRGHSQSRFYRALAADAEAGFDINPFDNGASRKEGVSRTYQRHDGYSPIAGYIGDEG